MKLSQSTFLVRIGTAGAAFDTGDCSEIARMLRAMADSVENVTPDELSRFQSVRDINGNVVGQYAIKPEGYEG